MTTEPTPSTPPARDPSKWVIEPDFPLSIYEDGCPIIDIPGPEDFPCTDEDDHPTIQAEGEALTRMVLDACQKYPALVALEVENAKLSADLEIARKGLIAVRQLIIDSMGVAGLHKNGDLAPWDSLTMGGHFESWLIDYSIACEVLIPYTPKIGDCWPSDLPTLSLADGRLYRLALHDGRAVVVSQSRGFVPVSGQPGMVIGPASAVRVEGEGGDVVLSVGDRDPILGRIAFNIIPVGYPTPRQEPAQ